MKIRSVFSTNDLDSARAAMDAALQAGIPDDDIALVAREDIEHDQIPDHLMTGCTDFYPAAVRGMACAGGTGVVLGLVAAAIPPLGVTLTGAGAMALAAAAIGGWTGALVGSEVPDVVHRRFKGEIDSGHILVVIDGDRELLSIAEPAIEEAGAIHLPFRAHTMLT
ncbi:hypothetical protein [Dyella silvae]|uniref:hypothetical protein n=1 Tax=Dyella silvae TaxID=2994424 RepID=UPI002264C976|nr:hypothetical protein [Dyella silvae]